MSKKKVLVTGATGFLGRHLVKELCAGPYNIEILARKSSDLSPFKDLPINVRYGDITQTLPVLEATEGQDIVFHLAGLIAYKRSQRKAMEKVNVQGTRNLIDACITHNTPQVLHLSSVVAIGASPSGKSFDEEAQFNLGPYNLGYFETKRKAEAIAMDAFQEHGLPVYILNPSTIYGPGDATKGSRKTQIKVAKGKFKFYTPGGVNVVHVDDVIRLMFLALEKGQPGRRYIAAGDNLTIQELFEIIANEAGVPKPTIGLPKWFLKFLGAYGDFLAKLGKDTSLSSETAVTSTLFHWYDSLRAQKELGFKPRPSREAIAESIRWMKDHGIL